EGEGDQGVAGHEEGVGAGQSGEGAHDEGPGVRARGSFEGPPSGLGTHAGLTVVIVGAQAAPTAPSTGRTSAARDSVLVAETPDGDDAGGVGRVVLDLGPEALDVDVEG